MNENRGQKTIQKDWKRTLLLTEQTVKKLKRINEAKEKKELEILEKKVKHLQVVTLLKTIPLIVTGSLFKSIANSIETLTKEEPIKKSSKKEIAIEIKEKQEKEPKQEEFSKKNIEEQEVEKKEKDETKEEKIESKKEEEKKEELTQKGKEKLEQLKNKKILKSYEEKLKQKRTEVKEIASTIPETSKGVDTYRRAEEVYRMINLILLKLEELEDKIQIDDRKYNDAYIEYLIDYYTKELGNGKIIEELKDSELYIAISKKLKELELEKQKLKRLAKQTSKEEKEEKEEYQEKLKEETSEDTFSYEKEEKEFNDFQEEQRKIIALEKEKEEQIKTDYDRIKIQVEALKKECDSLKQMITKRSLIKPSIRNAKLISVAILTSIYFMRSIMKGKRFKNVRKHLKKREYQRNIETSMIDISSASNLLNQTMNQVNSLIAFIEANYKLQGLAMVQDLLNELEEIKRILEERQYEIEKEKEKQEDYQRNSGKVYRK